MKAGRVIGALLGAALMFFAVGAYLSNEPASKTDQGRIMVIVAFAFGFVMVISNAAGGSKAIKSAPVAVPPTQPVCPTCKRPVLADYQICPYCATALQRHCPSCHKEVGPDFKVCPYCGTNLPNA